MNIAFSILGKKLDVLPAIKTEGYYQRLKRKQPKSHEKIRDFKHSERYLILRCLGTDNVFKLILHLEKFKKNEDLRTVSHCYWIFIINKHAKIET